MNLLSIIPGGPLVRGLVLAAAVAAVAAAVTYQVKAYNEARREEGRDQVRMQVQADQAAALQDKFKADEKLRRNRDALDQTIQDHTRARAVADAAADVSLRQLAAALARAEPGPADPAAPGSADAARAAAHDSDPRPRIAAECGSVLQELDARYRRLVDEKAGLQKYARDVCLAAGQTATAPGPIATEPMRPP